MIFLAIDALFLILFILAFVLSEKTNIGFYLCLIGAMAYWFIFGGGSLAVLVAILPKILILSVAYFGIGIIWSFIKWYLFTHEDSNIKYQVSNFEDFMKRKDNEGKALSELQEKFLTSEYNNLNYRKNIFKLHKWVIYWPLSIISVFLGDFLYQLMVYVIKSFGKIYDNIAGGTKNLN